MKSLTIIGIGVVAALVAAAGAGKTHEVWLATSCQTTNARPPCPTPEINPFGVQGSGLGRTLASYLTLSGEAAEHLGVKPMKELPFTLPSARAISEMEERLVTVAPHSHENVEDGHKEDDAHERQESVAEGTMNAKVKTAWLCDPTNYDALKTYAGYVGRGGGGQSVFILERGKQLELPLGAARSVLLYRHSLARYDVASGKWPEHCIYAANALFSIWLAEYPVAPESAERDAALREVLSDVEKLLRDAHAQLIRAQGNGAWEAGRTPDERSLFGRRMRETEALLREAKKILEKQEAPSGDFR